VCLSRGLTVIVESALPLLNLLSFTGGRGPGGQFEGAAESTRDDAGGATPTVVLAITTFRFLRVKALAHRLSVIVNANKLTVNHYFSVIQGGPSCDPARAFRRTRQVPCGCAHPGSGAIIVGMIFNRKGVVARTR
jgi:hypothetical protein